MLAQIKRNNMGDINIISLISGLVVAIGGLIGSVVTIKKVKADIAKEKQQADSALSNEIVKQAKDWLQQQGVYIDELTKDTAAARAESKSLKEEMESFKKDQEKLIEEQARREEAYQSYIRYLLRNIKDLTQQICDLGQAPVFTPMSFDEYIRWN